MENPSIHGSQIILSAAAHAEEYRSSVSLTPPTKVIQVTWIHPLPSTLVDGEWSVYWEGMGDGQNPDEGYGSLAGGSDGQAIPLEDSQGTDTGTMGGTEAGHVALEAMDDDFFEKIFQDRSVVQTPARITPPVTSSPRSPKPSSQKFSIFFFLSHPTDYPKTITIRFTPIWASPVVPSPTVTIPVNPVSKDLPPGDLHKAWAKSRLVDLHELQELADELARTGQRGVGMGSFKVGVDGGGHDEERLQWEAEMVGRERNWVLKTFLGKVIAGKPLKVEQPVPLKGGDEEGFTEKTEIEQGLEVLGKLAQGLKVTCDEGGVVTDANTITTRDSPASHLSSVAQIHSGNDDEEDDLFAVPLSPRSPDITVSPFSFRGPAIGNLDEALLSGVPATQKKGFPAVITPSFSAGAIPVASGAPLTPTLTGTPSPGGLRKKRLAGPGVSP